MLQESDSLRTLLNLLEPDCPDETKVELLRQLDAEQWEALIVEAKNQAVSPFLYSLLVELENSSNLDFPKKDQLHQGYILTAARNTLILHDTEQLFSSLRDADIDVVGLKGIYLLENVYTNVGARPMNDIDILIKKSDLADSISVLEGLGYTATAYFSLDDQNIDTKHVPPMQKKGGAMVEVHWTLLEEDEPFTIDTEELWERTLPAKIANVDALSLGVEDLILHLCLHMTYQHYLQLGMRGLMDIALVIEKFENVIDWQKLVRIANSWGAQRVTALTLKLVETLLKVAVPVEVGTWLLPEGFPPSLLEQARNQLMNHQKFEDQLTPGLVELNATKSIGEKIKIGLQRVFIPRLALARIYNIPPNSPRILGFYGLRLKYLIRNYGRTMHKLQRGENSTASALREAETSYALHHWLTNRGS